MAVIINSDSWDRRSFINQMNINPDLQRVEKEGSRKASNYAEFVKDVFYSAYKFTPTSRDPNTAPQSEQWMDQVLNEVTQLQEWKNLRSRTKVDEDASAVAAATFCEKFLDAIPKDPDKPEQGQAGQFDMSKVRRTAREACKEAADEADKTTERLGAFGFGNSDGRPQYASPTEKTEVAKRLVNNRKLQQIAELAGRMRRIAAEKQKQKTKHGVDELCDISIGDDLSRLIPAEISKLAHPLLKMDFRKKFLEKQLMQYQLRGREKLCKGTIVCCIDESGSMEGSPDIWAKSVALALLMIAQKQKRKFALVHFNSHVTRTDKFEGKANATDVIDAVAYFSNGGTDFMRPLNAARDIIKENNNYKDADVCLITDGCCDVDNEWLAGFIKDKKELQFNVISIIIGCEAPVCEQFSNKVITLDSINDDSAATHEMFSI